MTTVTVTLGPQLFAFTSFEDWIDTARRKFGAYHEGETVCLDQAGRIVTCGKEFMRARDEGTYPVTVYLIDPKGSPRVMTPKQRDKLLAIEDDERALSSLLARTVDRQP